MLILLLFYVLLGIAILTILLITRLVWPKTRFRQVLDIKRATRSLNAIRCLKGQYANAQAIVYLRKLNPFVFEELILSCFHESGYHITRNKRYTGDGGIDGIVYKNNEKFIIQAKRYKGYIQKKHLDSFQNLIKKTNASGGFFVHTGKTGQET